MRKRYVVIILLATCGLAAGLMIGAMRQESATVDETSYLGAGYCYFQTGSYRFMVGHPILSQLIASFPIRAFKIHESPDLVALRQGRVLLPYACRWSGPVGSTRELFPNGPDFYHWPPPESQLFGQRLIYDPENDAEGILFSARLPQVALTLGLALLLFFWGRELAGSTAGLIAATIWIANPVVLGYGHLILSDMSVTLLLAATVWLYIRFLERPSARRTLYVGITGGLSLATKFTALSLLPMFAIITAVAWWRMRDSDSIPTSVVYLKRLAVHLSIMAAIAWVVIMLIYFPNWRPAPPISPERAQLLGVPGWFQTLRPILLPRDYFKELALMVGHIQEGGDSYLMGEWSRTGWWYYYILGMIFKSPVPWLLLFATGLATFVRKRSLATFGEIAPWAAAFAYLCFSMTSKVNIGVRHVLPVYALLSVAIAAQVVKLNRPGQLGTLLLCGWLWVIAVVAYPFYIPYFNELVGGTKNGYEYLIDSNFDWGQDAIRLKRYLNEQNIGPIYLDYFGTQAAIEYYKIPNQRVNGEVARQIQHGWLVVSASQLMRPEWAWLRDSRKPIARVAYTLFVYQFP